MTEKRFTCDDDYYKGLILKDNLTNEILEEDGIGGYYTACNKLNELYGENEQLKEILHFLQNDNAEDILNVLNTQQNEIGRLIKENEQLKEEKEKWKSSCSLAISENSILWNEINILREQGAEPSDAFKNYLNKKRS